MSDYPEADKWKEFAEQRDVVSEFMEWLTGQEIELCEFKFMGTSMAGYHPIDTTTENLLKQWLGIDAQKLEAERRAMLDAVRNA